MNQQLTPQQVAQLTLPIPIKAPMTRQEKLKRLATIVREYGHGFFVFHGLEYADPMTLRAVYHPQSAFAIALADKVLAEAGLKADLPDGNISVGGAAEFFDLSQHDLHEFSCDCGGAISNNEMANRIERLAG